MATSAIPGRTAAQWEAVGPVARNIHGVGEAVELASIVRGSQTLTRFIAGFFGGDGQP